jgi:hypothetical protein
MGANSIHDNANGDAFDIVESIVENNEPHRLENDLNFVSTMGARLLNKRIVNQ